MNLGYECFMHIMVRMDKCCSLNEMLLTLLYIFSFPNVFQINICCCIHFFLFFILISYAFPSGFIMGEETC